MPRQQPRTSVMVEVSDCRMHGVIESDGQLLFTLGWPKDHTLLQFTPAGLHQFVQLATQLLATPRDQASTEPVSATTPIASTSGAQRA